MPTLSRRSTITRSADFLPTPAALLMKVASALAMAFLTSSASASDNIAMAALGPIPWTPVRSSKIFLAAREEKPYNSSEFSRTAW